VRRYLTPKERKAMLEGQGGLCRCRCGCKADISTGPSIAEHTVCVALGNTDKPDRLLCVPCADRKTNGSPATSYGSDKHAIAKCRRIRKKLAGTQRKARPLQSRGFQAPPEGFEYSWPSRPMRREARR
jgi:hypothetical protein